MLINGKDLLAVANDHNFAVPAFNVSDYAMSNGLFEICEEKAAPWILAIHPDEVSHIGHEAILALRERAHRSSVPVAIHWDHGGSYEQILTAIKVGFTSVMIDGSMLPFEENVAITKRVADSAHAVGLSVEGELGTIGKTDDQAEAGTDDIIYTDPAQAAEFIERTGVDSLAVAIGTRHGIYPSTLKPELKLDLLTEIKRTVGIPLVLHGGSNNPDGEIGQSVKLGINKINISSDIKVAYFDAMREVLADRSLREPNLIEPPAAEAMKRVAAQKIDLFDAGGKAHLYANGLAAASRPAGREAGTLVG
ncbi:ketose-bisphosphate aldolase [Sinomonas humi]|uniref:ketose-bisphosphate aldolase n=1 Tax=Sinomonas humi TaxID=1338436 RepID=UPI0009DE4DB3|nr:ketose-bisphosphate aldolase [Sinomonas humi]